MAFIRVENVGMRYEGRPILNDLTLDIHEGDFVCLLGQTGCGKSTLLRLVLGSERPTSGRILIEGTEHQRPDQTRGYVPQKYSLFPDRTVLDNITFGCEMSEFSLLSRFTPRFYHRRKELRARAFEFLDKVGLTEADGAKYPAQLSGGMQQRVAIAQALMTKPSVLLMDEAFSALDPATRDDMQNWIRDLWRETKTTIIFVTHNTQEALRMGTRIVVLAKDSPDSGSRVRLDLPVPNPCLEEDMPPLVRRLESESRPSPSSKGSVAQPV